MKKTTSRILALSLALVLILSGCNPGGTGDKGTRTLTENSIKDLVIYRLVTRELETFNILHSQNAADFENLSNLVDGLLEPNNLGALGPGLAETYGTEDGGKTWTFNLRKGVVWVDMNGTEKAPCVAQDYATGLEWVLNYHKNESANTQMPTDMIVGATEYYEYTKDLSEAEAFALTAGPDSKFMEMVGIAIPDDYTVIYTCKDQFPYFDSVASYSCLYPMAQGMIDEMGSMEKVKAMNNETMWYNGCYTMTSYIHTNEKIFTKNPLYWDKDCILFDTVTVKMVDSADVAFQLYQAGEIDYVSLSESNLKTISENPDNPYYNYLIPDVFSRYSYQFHFNYDKNKEDGTPDTNWNTAIANEAFRLCWYYGLDLTNYYKRTNMITPLACENNFYTMKGLVYNSKGEDYVELVRKELGLPAENGESMVRLDANKTAQLKAQAMSELAALGVSFPVGIDYYISASSQTALDTANVLKQLFSDCLGDDFVTLNIKTYVSALRAEVINPSLHSIAINGWGADYGDPVNYVCQETYGDDNAYYSANYSYINKIVGSKITDANKDLIATYEEFTRLANEASAITTDMDARYAAFAKAEAYMLEHALVVPCSYSVGWALGKVDNSSKINAMYGCQNDKMKNWVTNSNGFTTAEAAELAAKK